MFIRCSCLVVSVHGLSTPHNMLCPNITAVLCSAAPCENAVGRIGEFDIVMDGMVDPRSGRVFPADPVSWIPVDVERPDLDKFPLFRHASPVKCVVKPGEVLVRCMLCLSGGWDLCSCGGALAHQWGRGCSICRHCGITVSHNGGKSRS